jgi:hypothetical protein
MFITTWYRQLLLATCVVVAALAFAGPAMAENGSGSAVTQDQYGDSSQQIAAAGDTSATDPPATGSLPFTGLDIGMMSAAAIALVGGGLLMRRRSGPEAG